jgi:hypothetical protein
LNPQDNLLPGGQPHWGKHMAHDSRADISDRAQRLLTLSDELKELSYLVQQHAASGLQLPDDLLKRNQELIEQCDRLASEMLLLRSI